MTTVVLCLAFSGRLLWLRVFTLAFICAVLISITVSAALPAAGAWPYYGLAATDPEILPAVSTSWPVFHGLRDGTFRLLVAVGSEGIITFPSLHAALAVIVVAALWPVAVLRWVFLALNTAMLIATPIDGSHYFIDIMAGIALAAVSMMIARARQRTPACFLHRTRGIECAPASGRRAGLGAAPALASRAVGRKKLIFARERQGSIVALQQPDAVARNHRQCHEIAAVMN